MWIIVSVVTALEFFGPKPHEFSSNQRFGSQAECMAYMPQDADEILSELESMGLTGTVHLESRCEIDKGNPA
jgi:hypothetical protein